MSLQLKQNINLRMEQKLRLTPQMIQSIEILLLPQMALEERIMNEVESNPALEVLDAPGPEAPPSAESHGTERISAPDAADLDWAFKRRATRDEDAPDKMEALESTAERQQSLADYLLDQLRFQDIPDDVRALLPDLCWQLDRRGYLTQPLSELFPEEKLEHAEQALECVRHCDPPGIGARDLRDCLLLQLARERGDNSFEMTLVRDHLDDVLKNRLPAIAAVLGVEVGRVQEGVEAIRTLDPKPGIRFANAENQFVVPDVVVELDENDEWVVSVPDGHLPKVQVNQSYYQLYDSPSVDPKERAYLKDKLAGAKFIVDAVAQRRRTLLKIVSEIIKHQTAFLELGPEHLRPLMRQDIADKIGMHVATVSRAVKDKYIQTPAGVLPLASFFSGGIASSEGEAESSKSVKLKIQKLIGGEDNKNPLSDQEIADILEKEGLDISRRTVTKYRIADGVPSTRQRRSF